MAITLTNLLLLSADIGVSVGTLLLAFFTWRIIKNNNLQMKLIQKQYYLMEAQQNPYLQIKDIEFQKNKIWFKLKNTGNGDAYSVGVLSKFYKTKRNIEEYKVINNQLMGKARFDYDILPLIDYKDKEKRKILKNGNVDFLKREDYQNIIIKSGEELEFCVEPYFFLGYTPGNKFVLGTWGRKLNLNDLKELLTQNNVQFVYLEFSIVSKNAIHENMENLPLVSFVYDIKNHKSLEESFKQSYKANITAISPREIERRLGSLDYETYKHIKPYKE